MANLVKAKDAKLWVFQSYSDDCQAAESTLIVRIVAMPSLLAIFLY